MDNRISRVTRKSIQSVNAQSNISSQAGVALISVLLVVALLVTIISYAFESQLLTVKRVTNQAMFEQSYQLAIGGEQWAASLLMADLEDPVTAVVDHKGEAWNNAQEKIKVDVGQIDVQVEDLSGKLNLNSLYFDKAKFKKQQAATVAAGSATGSPGTGAKSKKAAYPVEFTSAVWMLVNLYTVLEIDTRLVGNLVDWMDADDSNVPLKDLNDPQKRALYEGGAEDFHYTSLEKPYRAANQQLKSLGELRFVKGYSKAIIKKIQPYVVVLPTSDLKINLNTTSKELLMSMANLVGQEPINIEDVLEEQKNPNGIPSIDIVANGAKDSGWMPNVGKIIDVKSAFFKVTTKASFDELSYSMVSTLNRSFKFGSNGKPEQPVVVLRERKIL